MHELQVIGSPVGAEIVLDGRRYVNFTGSSYLGVSGLADVLEAGVEALRSTGAGYQISRENGMVTRAHQELEAEAAAYFNSPAAMYTASGYYFGLISIAALREQFDAVFFDELAHHCLRDGIAVAGLRSYPYRHLDAEDLATQLGRHLRASDRPLIVTDGMYSSFGSIAPLDELARVAVARGGRLLVDESHSFGVLGPTGRGALEQHGLSVPAALVGGSLSKAFGASGGVILATENEITAFRATSVSRGSAVGMPAAAAMCAKSLRYVREHPQLLSRLRANIAYFKQGLRNLGLPVKDTLAPVAAFAVGTQELMQKLKDRLLAEGICVSHSKYIGTGAAGAIRCGIFADHTTNHFDRLLDSLRRLL